MSETTEAFRVVNRFHPTWNGIWLTVGCVVFTAVGVALILRGTTGGIIIGGMAVLLCGGGGLLAATTRLSRRPVLELDSDGVTVVVPWPQTRTDDRRMHWDEVAAIVAHSQILPFRKRTARHDYIAFVPAGAPREAPEATETDSPPSTPGVEVPWRLRYSAHIRPTWSAGVDGIVAAARRFRPDLPFEDRRGEPAAAPQDEDGKGA
ncbi:hypothetical protein CLV63_106245 [Murinocardiopsis flavida]|uniref:PH (Pleckstrin Homology) domain-containing protein n=1 Tax=Murinocardiopsis flavida TaxID=645275 RepID=A0A2P8DLY6_9ACTN|nr:STM3941 family protein [Murinocardiopsis flavida]PSK98197.1 hypothetical protein CLV63_106245 [Murinocardiopsis flavida]